MSSGTSWANSSGFGQSQSTSSGLFGNTTQNPGFGARSSSMANLLSLLNNANSNPSAGPSLSLFGSSAAQAQPSSSSSFSLGGNALGGGLFGNSASAAKPANATATGGLFGNSGNSNAQQGGLFGNSGGNTNTNTALTGGLFGNTPSQSSGVLGNSNNNMGANTTSGGLFGNTNTAATSSNPAGGLFGNSNNTSNTQANSLFGGSKPATTSTTSNLFGGLPQASAAPSGGLFGNSASSTNKPATGGLFGGSANTAQSGGLFGNTSNNQSGGLFGNSTNNQSGGLFGSANSGGLFGNSSASNNMAGQGSNAINSISNADPYKSDTTISSINKTANVMPQSITGSLFEAKSSTLERRQSQPDVKPQPKKSSLLGKLAQTFNIFRAPANTKSTKDSAKFMGIFTQQNYATEHSQIRNDDYSIGKKRPHSQSLKLGNRNVGDIRKLVIKSKPSRFDLIDANKVLTSKRRRVAKPLTSLAYQNNILTDEESSADEKEAPVKHIAAGNHLFSQPEQASEPKSKQAPLFENSDGYFCSPSIKELSMLPTDQLASVFNFIVGRVGHGQIAYNYPVDLSQLYERCDGDFTQIQNELFGKIIKIDKTIVRAYDDPEVESPPMGCELNVPATITLVAPPTSNRTVEDHIKRLQNIIGMDFITYDPILFNWTFKVKHFSVWGLIDDGEEEADEAPDTKRLRDLKKEQDAHEDEANDTYTKLYENSEYRNELKRQKIERQTSALPGGWLFDTTIASERPDVSLQLKQQIVRNEINQEINHYKEGKSALVLASNASDITVESDSESEVASLQENFGEAFLPAEPRQFDYLKQIVSSMPSSAQFDDLVDEKAYEPDIEDEKAFEMVKYSPSIPSTKDWILQLELANDIDSALAPTTVIDQEKLALQAVNEILFADISKGPVDLGQASTPLKEKKLLSITEKPLISIDKNAAVRLIQSIMINSKIEARKNGFPQLSFSADITFETFSKVLVNDEDHELLELASILLDPKNISGIPEYSNVDLGNIPLVKRLESNHQKSLLAIWFRKHYEALHPSKSSDLLDAIFEYLCCGEIKKAVEKAIESQNLHLASLITLIDSNDSAVKNLASGQLDSWNDAQATSLIPTAVVDIHRLLAGKYDQLSKKPVKNLSLALKIFYGSNSETIDTVTQEKVDSLDSGDLQEIFRIYSYIKRNLIGDAASYLARSNLSLKFKWIMYQASKLHSEASHDCDSVTQKLVAELESAGLWKEAIAVAASMNSAGEAHDLIRQIVLANVDKLNQEGGDDEKFLVTVLKVPRGLIYEAISIEKRQKHDFWGCCQALATAELWDEAHEVIVNELGPMTVVENATSSISRLLSLIEAFPSQGLIITSWNQGAGLFARYFEVLESYEESSQVANEDIVFLLDNIALATVPNTFAAKTAFKVMSRRIADLALASGEKFSNLDDKLFSLKLGENEKRYLTSRLAAA
ncbi:hypothetical protein PUMCH_003064 [Australozyma saopauloensis]|uniref:Peptidase S59 domain-containing protein n=1 Tax=Australozyma saopauloensis TaxID=291208 RepID=A0AAX4HD13_9ASCO|nr:hypothetical protein PUMCH_003064 [[Candida] saopauloensis]